MKPIKDMKFRLQFFFTYSSTYELNIIQKLFWTLNRNIFKVPQIYKKMTEKAKKLNFTVFTRIFSIGGGSSSNLMKGGCPSCSSHPLWDTMGCRELFLPENYLKTWSTLNSWKRWKKGILWLLELYLIWSTFPTKMIYCRGKL